MTQQPQIATLTEFFRQSGTKYRIFDLARRVEKISAATFEQFELAATPYPNPFQRTALMGVIFWHPKAANQHYVWFLKFPLDEQGLLLQAARDEFLVTVLDRVGESMLAAADGQKLQGALKDSPYSFKPREDRMAFFNAQASYSLGVEPSQFYQPALHYFTGQTAPDSWMQLGMQGVADVAARMDEASWAEAVMKQLPSLPVEPVHMLMTFLENVNISTATVEQLGTMLESELSAETSNLANITAYLRAMANTSAEGLLKANIAKVLGHPVSQHIELLALISGRCWQVLTDADVCQSFLEALAENEAGYEGFSHILSDLIYLPNMRGVVMAALRNPERSDALSACVGRMFGQA
jgi:hypothetical protein